MDKAIKPAIDVKELVRKANEMKKANKLDLSSDEDLSIALMNLISIEEHLYFSAMKTGKRKYIDMLKSVREVRKKYLKEIVKNPEGEEWCISKHLLAASMRLIEVGTKHLAKNEIKKSEQKFRDAFDLYSMFFGINLGLIKSDNLISAAEKKEVGKKASEIKKGWKEKLSDTIKSIVDCCIE